MNVVLFGATGMIGQGVLRECLLDPEVDKVLAVGRRPTGKQHEKLQEAVVDDLGDLSSVAASLAGYDACFFCVGVTSAGTSESDYRRVTYDYAVTAARAVLERSPAATFVLVTGAGTDGSGKSNTMWARIKGEAENAISKMPFRATYMVRPGLVQPLHGITSRTRLYRVAYAVLWPLTPVWKALFPNQVTTTERLGRAMLIVAKKGASKRILETRDLNDIVEGKALST